MSTYKTLHEYGMDEIIIEKSTFIGYAKPIKTEEEAIEFINEIKKKHKDAIDMLTHSQEKSLVDISYKKYKDIKRGTLEDGLAIN